MEIRKYEANDYQEVLRLFRGAICNVNIQNYNKEQISAWLNNVNEERMSQSLLNLETYVAIMNDKIVGFGNIDTKGYLDMLYAHKDYQGQRIASMLCERLESVVEVPVIYTHASITALPFFEKRGYNIIEEQVVKRGNVTLKNYVMKKKL